MDIIGKKFGKLTVLKFLGFIKTKSIYECLCDCGNIKIVKRNSLVSEHTKSCGCLEKGRKTHGKRHTNLYNRWLNMKDRCNNENNSHFKYYGGKNIKLCEKWENNFMAFHDWAINNGYKKHLSIERKNNDLGYSEENCEWIPKEMQSKNKTNNIIIDFNGERMLLIDFAIKHNMVPSSVYGRYAKGKRGEELIKKSKVMIKNNINGELLTFKTISKKYGIPEPTLRDRYRNGKRDNEILNYAIMAVIELEAK